MSTQFHINRNGVPAPCRARPGNCPLGGDETHFKTKKEAQIEADRRNEAEFGIFKINKKNELPIEKKEITHKKAVSIKQFQFIERRKREIRNQRYDNQRYINRCKSTERLKDYVPSADETHHYKIERGFRERLLINEFGEGKVIGYYKVNHLVGQDNQNYKEQIVEIRDTGQIKIYDANTGRTITTFMAHRQRIEVMMLQSGEIPQEIWMRKVNENRDIASRKNLDFEG